MGEKGEKHERGKGLLRLPLTLLWIFSLMSNSIAASNLIFINSPSARNNNSWQVLIMYYMGTSSIKALCEHCSFDAHYQQM